MINIYIYRYMRMNDIIQTGSVENVRFITVSKRKSNYYYGGRERERERSKR